MENQKKYAYIIITDSSANLPESVIADNAEDRDDTGVHVIPFTYSDGSDVFTCPVPEEFDGHAYYESIKEGTTYSTSQITPVHFEEVFEKYASEGYDILYIGMSGGISGTYASSEKAAENVRSKYDVEIYTVNTKSASMGEGLVVIEAIRCRKAGMSLSNAYVHVLKYSENMCQIFTVDDLDHLKRTGRVSGFAARIGTILSIKPVLMGNENGQIIQKENVRGRRKALKYLADAYNEWAAIPELRSVSIAHADSCEDAEYLAELLKEKRPPHEIITVCYEPVTGSHVGPGTIALFFEGDPGFRKSR